MARYKKEELKHMAKVIMFNPDCNRAQELLVTVANRTGMHPLMVLANIDQLTEGERL